MKKVTPSQRIQLTHIECEPIWDQKICPECKEIKYLSAIVLFDMYLKTTGEWIGSKRLLRYCEELDARL